MTRAAAVQWLPSVLCHLKGKARQKKVYQQCDEGNVLSSFSPVMRFSPGLNQIFWRAEKKKQEKHWERICVVNPTAREESPRGVLWSVKPPHYYQSSRQPSPSLELLHAQMKVQCWRQIEIATVCWTHLRRHHDSTGKNSIKTSMHPVWPPCSYLFFSLSCAWRTLGIWPSFAPAEVTAPQWEITGGQKLKKEIKIKTKSGGF